MTARIYHAPCAEVLGGQEIRNQVMASLKERMLHVPQGWQRAIAFSSLTVKSPCGRRILKIDSSKVFTMDNKQQDGSWKSLKFTCKTLDEAWSMLTQSIKAFDAQKARNALH